MRGPIVYFDLETGGTEPYHPNTQLAAIVMDEHGREIGEFNKRIQFDPSQCNPEALAINHYSPEKWADAEPLWAVVAKFSSFLKSYRWVKKISKQGKPYSVAKLAGYNAAAFDGPRLKAMFGDKFLPAEMPVLDVFQGVKWFFDMNAEQIHRMPENLKLGTVCEYFGIPLLNAHDALADVRATGQLANVLMAKRMQI